MYMCMLRPYKTTIVPRLLSGARTLSLTPCGHPIVDVAKLKAGCSATTDDLRTALFDYGYFYAANVEALSAEYIRSIYACTSTGERTRNLHIP